MLYKIGDYRSIFRCIQNLGRITYLHCQLYLQSCNEICACDAIKRRSDNFIDCLPLQDCV